LSNVKVIKYSDFKKFYADILPSGNLWNKLKGLFFVDNRQINTCYFQVLLEKKTIKNYDYTVYQADRITFVAGIKTILTRQ